MGEGGEMTNCLIHFLFGGEGFWALRYFLGFTWERKNFKSLFSYKNKQITSSKLENRSQHTISITYSLRKLFTMKLKRISVKKKSSKNP